MQLGQFIVGQIEGGETLGLKSSQECGVLRAIARLDADENMRIGSVADAVVELGDIALAEHRAETAKAAALLRNGDGKNRLVVLAPLRALRNQGQAGGI